MIDINNHTHAVSCSKPYGSFFHAHRPLLWIFAQCSKLKRSMTSVFSRKTLSRPCVLVVNATCTTTRTRFEIFFHFEIYSSSEWNILRTYDSIKENASESALIGGHRSRVLGFVPSKRPAGSYRQFFFFLFFLISILEVCTYIVTKLVRILVI